MNPFTALIDWLDETQIMPLLESTDRTKNIKILRIAVVS
jgi:hypothetical protein